MHSKRTCLTLQKSVQRPRATRGLSDCSDGYEYTGPCRSPGSRVEAPGTPSASFPLEMQRERPISGKWVPNTQIDDPSLNKGPLIHASFFTTVKQEAQQDAALTYMEKTPHCELTTPIGK